MNALRLLLVCAIIASLTISARADIYRWDTGEVIPGTEGIQLGPGVQLDHRELEYANLGKIDLTTADFSHSNLAVADMGGAALLDADFSGAIIKDATLWGTTGKGFTKEQLYSTASYKSKDLGAVFLDGNDLSEWDFSGQNLKGAHFNFEGGSRSDLSNSRFVNTNLQSSDLQYAVLVGADLTHADLRQSDLSGAELSNALLVGANLADANLWGTSLSSANFSGAIVNGASFYRSDITEDQLYSTASFQMGDLSEIDLRGNSLAGWSLKNLNLANAKFHSFRCMCAPSFDGTDLSGSDLRGAAIFGDSQFNAALTRNTIMSDGHIRGLSLTDGESLDVREYGGEPDRGPEFGPDPGPLAIVVESGASIVAGSALKLELKASWHSLISFEPGIPIQLDGTLELTFADDVLVPAQVGRTIRVFDWTGVAPAGTFAVSSIYPWDLSQLYTTGEVTLLLPGDTNDDGLVNIEDLNNVRNNFGLVGDGLQGDTNADDVVDVADLMRHPRTFGQWRGADNALHRRSERWVLQSRM